MNFGEKIRVFRKKMKMTQKELCYEICSQSMLSQIEQNENIPNIILAKQLCMRLGISVDELLDVPVEELVRKAELREILYELFERRQYKEINEYINNDTVINYFYTPIDKQLLCFYKSIYLAFEENKNEEAYQLLENGLNLTYFPNKKNLSYEELLILSNLGIVSMRLNLNEGALSYFSTVCQSIENNYKVRLENKITLVFYNVANAYSKMGYYQQALEVAIKGIEWANKPQIETQTRLSYLYYVKAYNEKILNIPVYIESYKTAYYLAYNKKDAFLMKYIQTKIDNLY